MPPHSSDPDGYESPADANQDLPFTLRQPTYLPTEYRLTQVAIEGYPDSLELEVSAFMTYVSESGDQTKYLIISARAGDDPMVPGHPSGVDEEIMVGDCPGTCERTEHVILDAESEEEAAKAQNGVLEFIDSVGTYYYLNGPFSKEELIRIAESFE